MCLQSKKKDSDIPVPSRDVTNQTSRLRTGIVICGVGGIIRITGGFLKRVLRSIYRITWWFQRNKPNLTFNFLCKRQQRNFKSNYQIARIQKSTDLIFQPAGKSACAFCDLASITCRPGLAASPCSAGFDEPCM